MHARVFSTGLIGLAVLVVGSRAVAQSETSAAPPLPIKKTIVDFEIMMPDLSDPLDPQRWGPVFEKAGVAVRFRQQILNDEPSVTERIRGSYRMVNAVGVLDGSGAIHFPDGHSFDLDDADQLKTYIRDLQTYGAQGSPEGQPIWGLSEEQFEALFIDLARPVSADVDGLEFEPAIKSLGLPDAYPFRLADSARDKFQAPGAAVHHPLRHEVSGLARGTALAIVLADYGLGFRPLRMPGGAINLVAEPLDALKDPWPIGWPLEEKGPRNQYAPQLYEQVTAGFSDKPLADVLAAVEQASGTRVIVDYEKCARREIDPAAIKVSFRERKTVWSLVIHFAAGQAHLSRELKTDEAGTVFVYLFPFEPKQPTDSKPR